MYIYASLKARVRKTKEGITFAIVLTFFLCNYEARELLVLLAQNEVHGIWMELTDPGTEFPNLYQW